VKLLESLQELKQYTKCCLCEFKRHVKKRYLGVEVYLHAFLTFAMSHEIPTSLSMYVMNLKSLGKAARYKTLFPFV
jgi:hypothetical protein